MRKTTYEAPVWGIKNIAELFGRHPRTLERWLLIDAPEVGMIKKNSAGQFYAYPSEIEAFLKGRK